MAEPMNGWTQDQLLARCNQLVTEHGGFMSAFYALIIAHETPPPPPMEDAAEDMLAAPHCNIIDLVLLHKAIQAVIDRAEGETK